LFYEGAPGIVRLGDSEDLAVEEVKKDGAAAVGEATFGNASR